jgi:hypothetical protein
MPSDIVILERKIAELEVKIAAFIANDISEVKRNRLIDKKERYEVQLAELQA